MVHSADLAGMYGENVKSGLQIKKMANSWYSHQDIAAKIDLNAGQGIRYLECIIALLVGVLRYVEPSVLCYRLIVEKTMIKDEEFGVTDYDDGRISTAADVICTLFAPLLTTVPMFVLYFVSDIRNRLGIIMGFTTLFSIRLVFLVDAVPFHLCCHAQAQKLSLAGGSGLTALSLALFSSARRVEVFAATSAFAAVQVVYVTVNRAS